MRNDQFFAGQTTRSRVKSDIVAKYLPAWGRIVGPRARERGLPLGYLDLFSGPGRYEDGSESTPLRVLRNAIATPQLRDLLVARFNDADARNVEALRREINALPGVHLLRRTPRVFHYAFDLDIGRDVLTVRFPPTLFFVDPYGYKGLTQALIRGALKDWGCEVIFFFNFNRVNAALTNDCVGQHIDELFGPADAAELRRRVGARDDAGKPLLSPTEREQLVIDRLTESIREGGRRYVQHFAFSDERGSRTSHYLVHVTKSPLGYHIMKDIMAKASSWSDGGVASFTCGPAPAPTLFDGVCSPLDELKVALLTAFAGRSVLFGGLWQSHGLGRLFTARNYRDAVLQMEADGLVMVDVPSPRKRRPGTMPDGATVHFTARAGVGG